MLLLYATNVKSFTQKWFLYNFVTTQKNRQSPCSLLMIELKKTVLSITTVATTGGLLIVSTHILSLFFCIYVKIWVISWQWPLGLVSSTEIMFELTRVWKTGGSIMKKYLWRLSENAKTIPFVEVEVLQAW